MMLSVKSTTLELPMKDINPEPAKSLITAQEASLGCSKASAPWSPTLGKHLIKLLDPEGNIRDQLTVTVRGRL